MNNAEQNLTELHTALSKLSPLALKRRELFIKLASDMAEGAAAMLHDANNPERMEARFIGRNWYEAMRGSNEVLRGLSVLFFLKGKTDGLIDPTDEDDTAIKLETLRRSINPGSTH